MTEAALPERPLLELDRVGMRFGAGDHAVTALRDVSFRLQPGRAIALVGESGCGKTTCARLIAGLYRPTEGEVRFRGRDVTAQAGRAGELAYRRAVQMIFQDPFASLNPVFNVAHHLARPIRLHGHATAAKAVEARVAELLRWVGLDPDIAAIKFPHQLSGGQRQRVNIARALAVEPEILVADEPTSMLDVSIRLDILRLLAETKAARGLAMLYITHDIATAAHVAEEIVVMFAGQMVEWGDAAVVTGAPQHPYTRLLLSAVPDPDVKLRGRGSGAFQAKAEAIRSASRRVTDDIVQLGPNHFMRTVAEVAL
jgi:ABC-type glutathione transport system ATPase component